MSVVGIDFGLDTCYISVARAGGIETVANDYSMRDTPSFVGFGDQQRILGVGAKSQLLTNVKKTFFGFKPLLGRKFSDPVVQQEAEKLHYPISRGDNDSILVSVDYMGKTSQFTPEQITAMLFTKLKDTADQALQTKVKDVVISVPIFYTDRERRALLDAAAVAGLNVLKLMNDTTATALAYGIYKQDLPPTEEKARNVVFVDCGHRGIQAAACSFNKGKLVVQSCAFDENAGGRIFTEKLVEYFVEDFKKRYSLNARENPKAVMKLRSELEKIKKQMSANTNKLPLNIECFMHDKDVSGNMNRETFEQMIAPELERVEEVLRCALTSSKWKPEDIYSVEIVGGSTRVPAIKTLVEKVFGKTPNTTLNADEAVSRGCALQCAILSPTFKVREFSVTDVQPFPIKLRWKADSDNGDMIVFPQFHAVPFSKMLTFYRNDAFSVEAEYDGSVPIGQQHIGSFEVGEDKPQADGTSQKVKVKVRVNLNGIFTVASASVVEKQEVEEEVPVPMEVDAAKEEKKEGDNKNEGEEKAAAGEEMDTSADKEMETATSSPKEPTKMEKRKKIVNKTVELPVTSVAGSLSRDKLELLRQIEFDLSAQDKREGERLHAKNAVEEYIYDIRSKIYDELESFISEDARTAFSGELGKLEDWLYDDGEHCDKHTYEAKLKDLRLKGEPVKVRKKEFESRQAAVDALGGSLQMAAKFLEAFKAGEERYAHLDAEDAKKVEKTLFEKRTWLDKSCAELSKLDKTLNPPVLAAQFYSEKKSFEDTINPIINRPKPKPPKVEPPADDAASKGKTGEAGPNDGVEEAAADQAEQSVNGGESAPNMDLD